MAEIIFLYVLAIAWLVFAVVQDLKTREIANWLNFSLIAFALGFRFFYSLFSLDGFSFFYQGLLGLGIFFVIGNLLYYGKLFAGGDAKLMIALGPVLPIYSSFSDNLNFFLMFLLLFFFVGAAYSFTLSAVIGLRNFNKLKREFGKQFKIHRNFYSLMLILAIITALGGLFIDEILIFLGIFFFIFPLFYIYAKAADEAFMTKRVHVKSLTEGDWLYRDIKIGKKAIRATWHGLTKEEINLIRKSKKEVYIKEGMPFSPVFLISFILVVLFKDWFYFWNVFI